MKNKIDFENHFSDRKGSKFNNGILSGESVRVCVYSIYHTVRQLYFN